MNKIIDGKRYDTETAEQIDDWSNEYYPSDFQYYSETLYRKRTGEYFLHCCGGAMSPVAEPVGNNGWQAGAQLRPITFEEAQKWCEEHLDGDRYEEIFGEIGETDEDPSPLYVRTLSAEARAKLDREAERSGRTRGQIVEELLLGL